MWLNRKFLSMAPLPIADDEQLARFVLYSGWIRHTDQTIKPDAFIPYPHPNLSVTLLGGLSAQQIWDVGQHVGVLRNLTLYGRADVQAAIVRKLSLVVEPKPLKGNPNHANILGWPTEKPAQKIIALQLAAASVFHKP